MTRSGAPEPRSPGARIATGVELAPRMSRRWAGRGSRERTAHSRN
ncbi:hypothetical protein ACFPM0_25290 [Pseudonocardia sulfidoxydans]